MRIISILITLMLFFTATGCVAKDPKVETPQTSAPRQTQPIQTEPGRIENEGTQYRAADSDAYTYDTPILLDSFAVFEAFVENHPQQSENEDTLAHSFNEAFFDEHVLYAYVKSEGSGSIKLEVNETQVEGTVLSLFMKRTVPDIGTDDMATRICLFVIEKGILESVVTVEAVIETVEG